MTPPRSPRPLGFVDGIGVGIAAMAALPLLKIASDGGAFAGMYREMAPETGLPVLTRIVLHPAWRIGLPLALAAIFVAALVRRPRYGYAIFALGIFAALVVVVSYVGLYEPIMRLAGNIKAD